MCQNSKEEGNRKRDNRWHITAVVTAMTYPLKKWNIPLFHLLDSTWQYFVLLAGFWGSWQGMCRALPAKTSLSGLKRWTEAFTDSQREHRKLSSFRAASDDLERKLWKWVRHFMRVEVECEREQMLTKWPASYAEDGQLSASLPVLHWLVMLSQLFNLPNSWLYATLPGDVFLARQIFCWCLFQ